MAVPPIGRLEKWELFHLPNPHSDIDFTSALIAEMGSEHSTDLSRVYAMGYSAGGVV